jgi:Phage integrase family
VIDVNEVAAMVRELRAAGKSEWTIAGVLKAANRVFKFANRRLGWYGTNPLGQLEDGERPKLSAAPKRRASRSGRPLGQRNVLRALRRSQELAVDEAGRPTFPALHGRDERGRRLPTAPGTLPTFHSFRHAAASHAIAAGESAEEVSWQLGHRNSVVTRAIYVHELKTAERTARRRARLEADCTELVDGSRAM